MNYWNKKGAIHLPPTLSLAWAG